MPTVYRTAAWLGALTLIAGASPTGRNSALAQPGDDPWPEWQRTASRLGRTDTVGPRTPTISWRIQVDFTGFGSGFDASTVMDAAGRVFVGTHLDLTCVDTRTRQIAWQFPAQDNIDTAATIWQGRVLFGTAGDMFYCVDIARGEEIWSAAALPHPNRGQVVADTSAGAVVYYPTQSDLMYARLVEDGSEVWTVPSSDSIQSAPSLDGLGRLFIESAGDQDIRAHSTDDGRTLWTTGIGESDGTAPVEDARVYAAGVPTLYCLDAVTGEIIWSFEEIVTNHSAVALGHDGTIYIAEVITAARLFAISRDGEELWRYPVNAQVKFAPIVDGRGTIYLSSFSSTRGVLGEVHAVNPDGTGLWIKEMPDQVSASPMLAPDGTLYVLSKDKFLYAFRDLRGDMNCDATVNAFDIEPFLLALFDADNYAKQYPACNILLADVNEDGQVNSFDIEPFVELLFGP